MHKYIVYIFIGLIIFTATAHQIVAQSKFSGGVIGGISISQLNGDESYGYNKISPLGGVKAGYDIKERLQLEVELLYNEKGSQRHRKFRKQSPFWQINLKYFEIPVLVGFKDWKNEKGFYHMIFYTGASWAYLIDGNTTNEKYAPLLEGNFRGQDVSWILGATYHINEHLGITGRYNRSLLKVWKKSVVDDNYSNYMIGYQFSLAAQYLF